ncbi:MAG: iron ABC transporter permease [Rhodospirillaceae bacterium]|nr:iron ABC transporter permease [Rhodospirillaceae bacterium]
MTTATTGLATTGRLAGPSRRSRAPGARWPEPWTAGVFAVVLGATAIILGCVGVIVWISFVETPLTEPSRVLGLGNYLQVYADPFTIKVVLNTLGFAAVTLIVALSFGTPIAWLVARTNIRGKAIVISLMTIAVLTPGFTPAMGWLYLLHPKVGLINSGLSALFGSGAPVLDIISIVGMGWVQGLNLAPVAFIMMVSIFRSLNPALEEAAATCGARPPAIFVIVTLRLAWPGLLAASIFIFSIAFAVVDTPAIIGWSNRIFTYSTYLLSLVGAQGDTPEYGAVAALSVPMFLYAMAVAWLYHRIQRRARKYEVISGKAYRPLTIDLGRGGGWAWLFVGLYLALSILLPVLVLIWGSLLPVMLAPSARAFDLVSLANFQRVNWDLFWSAAGNTALLSVMAATIVTVLSFAFSWVVLRSRLPGRPLIDFVAFLPHVMPSTLFAVAALLVGLFVLDAILPIYGTIWILLVVLVVIRISYGTRMTHGAMIQIHRELDESALISGASPKQVMTHVLAPLMAPALLYTWLWTALLTCREMTAVMFLTTADNITLPYLIWTNLAGEPGGAAVLALFTMLMMLPFVLLFSIAMNRKGMISS